MRMCREDAPEDWHCEGCLNSNERVPLSTGMREVLPKASLLNTSRNLHCDPAQPNKLRVGSSWNYMEHGKKIQTGKVKPLSPQEVIKLSSGARKSGSPVKFTLRQSTMAQKITTTSILERTPVNSGAIHPTSSSPCIRANSASQYSKHLNLKPSRLGNYLINEVAQQQGTKSVKELKEKDAVRATLEKHTQEKSISKEQSAGCQMDIADAAEIRVDMAIPTSSHVNPQSINAQPILNSEKDAVQASQEEPIHKEQFVDSLKDVANAKMAEMRMDPATPTASHVYSQSVNGQSILTSGVDVLSSVELLTADPKIASPMSILPRVDKCFYGPALDASWKGSFKIFNSQHGDINHEILAHPSSRVRRKVYEFSKKMPKVLDFVLIPRGNLWINLFHDCCPDRKDIGLYFFPSNALRQESYISILDLLGADDLVMIKHMDGIELFVFTSKLLHKESQRWEGGYYLWGLFRCVKGARSAVQDDAPEIQTKGVNTNVVGMEIDGAAIQVDVHRNQMGGDNTTLIDMEIDMLGGENVGSVDFVVSRQPPLQQKETFRDIPPGFEKVGKLGLRTSYPSENNSRAGAVVKYERSDEDRYPNQNERCINISMSKGAATGIPSKSLGTQVSDPGCRKHAPVIIKSEFQ